MKGGQAGKLLLSTKGATMPTARQRFVGGFRQAWGESLAPSLGRTALIAAVVLVVLAFAGAALL